ISGERCPKDSAPGILWHSRCERESLVVARSRPDAQQSSGHPVRLLNLGSKEVWLPKRLLAGSLLKPLEISPMAGRSAIMFRHREDAGLRLAQKLKHRKFRDPVVLAIPCGGVVIGAILARELDAELDVVLARKLRAPGQPELSVGAIAEG